MNRLLGPLTIILVALSESVALGQIVTRTVAVRNQLAPGTDVVFDGIGLPTIDPSGNASFFSTLQHHGDPSTSQGMWSEVSGTLSLIARQGSVPPGYPPGPGYMWPFTSGGGGMLPISYGGGNIAFFASVNFVGGIWQGGAASVVGSAVGGTEAPGTGEAEFIGPAYYGFRANRGGQLATLATLNTKTGFPAVNDTGIWMGAPGALQYVASQNHVADGVPGATYGAFKSPVLNNNNLLAFSAGLTVGAGGVTTGNNSGVWLGTQGDLSLVLRKGDVAPSTGGQSFSEFRQLSINDAGQLLVTARTFPGGQIGMWEVAGSTVSTVLAPGSHVPGFGSDVHFTGFGSPAINGEGAIAFSGFIAGTGITNANNTGIWLESNGQLHSLAQAGQPVPGLGGTITFVNNTNVDFVPTMNSRFVAFESSVAIPGVNGNRDGIFAYDMAGNLVFSLIYGQQLQVQPGQMGTITDLRLAIGFDDFNGTFPNGTGGEDGRLSPLNDTNQLAFYAAYDQFGRGAFVATIPEPSSITLIAIGGAVLFLARRLRLGWPRKSPASVLC